MFEPTKLALARWKGPSTSTYEYVGVVLRLEASVDRQIRGQGRAGTHSNFHLEGAPNLQLKVKPPLAFSLSSTTVLLIGPGPWRKMVPDSSWK